MHRPLRRYIRYKRATIVGCHRGTVAVVGEPWQSSGNRDSFISYEALNHINRIYELDVGILAVVTEEER